MTPVFTPDFAAVDANIPIYEGRGRLQVTKRTPFAREKIEDGNVKVICGVRYGLEMIGMFDEDGQLDTEKKGKAVSQVTVWCHSEGGWQFAKPFIMATLGFSRKDEEAANEELFQNPKKISWDFSGDVEAPAESFELGNGWDMVVGKIVDVHMSKSIAENKQNPDEPYTNQEFNSWAPVSA